MSPENIEFPAIATRGEMADRFRTFDWAATRLGAVAEWPDRLLSAVETMLASRQMTTLAIGPERIFLYNDAAAEHYGARHPDVFGRPLEQAFAHEFGQVRDFYDRVFTGEGVFVREQPLDPGQAGAPEVFIAYLTPIFAADGKVIAAQMTGSAIGSMLRTEAATRQGERERRAVLERRIDSAAAELQASHDLLKGTIDSSDDMIQVFEAVRDDHGAIIDFRWILNNRTSERRYGKVTGKSLLRCNPGVVAEGIFDTFKRVTETGRPEKAERHYMHEQFDGWFFQSVVKLRDGVATTTKNIDAWKRAQADIARLQREAADIRLRESEGRFQTLADTAAAIIWQDDAEGANLFVNRYLIDYTGKSAAELSGHRWRELAHPDHVEAYIASYLAAVRDRLPWRSRNMLRRHDGAWRWFDNFAQPIFTHDGRYMGHVGVSTDVHDAVEADLALRESKDRQAFLLALGDRMRAEEDADAIVEVAARLLGERLRASRIVFAEIDEAEGVAHIRSAWIAGGAQEHSATLRLADFGGPLLAELRAGRSVRFDDIGEPPFARADLAALHAIGVRAGLSVPLVIGGRFVMNINIHQHAPRHWLPEELALVEEVAERLWAAVERARAEAALRHSEERLRQFGDASQDILWIRDAATLQWVYLTPAFEAIYGLSRDEALIGDNYRNWQDLIVPEDRAYATAALAKVRAGQRVTFEYRIRRPSDGAVRWLRDTDFPILDEDGRVALIGGIGHDFTDVRENELRFRTLVEGIPQLVWRAVDGGEWTWASPQWTACTGQGERDYLGRGWLDALHPDDRATAKEAWSHALEDGGFEVEYRLRRQHEGDYRWFQTRAAAVRDDAGTIIEWLGTSTDMDELRGLQQLQATLLAELQHRVRNILAVTRSIISRSDDGERSTEDYVQHLQGRISALARTQVLLTRRAGARIELEDLIRDELLAQVADDDQFALAGPDVALSPKAAEVLTLAIHELATNATKYGAFTRDSGRLKVRWTVDRREDAEWLALEWVESGVPIVDLAPHRRGFGAELVSRRIPYELKGTGLFELRPGGLYSRIEFPLVDGDSILQTDGVNR